MTKNIHLRLLPMRCILFLLTGLLIFTAFNRPFDELSRWWTVTVLVGNIITILVLLLVCRRKGITYGKFINYEKGKTKVGATILTVLVMLAVGMGGMQIAGLISYGEIPHFPVMMIQPVPLWLAIINIILLPLTTTLAEDGLYLGVINQNDSMSVVILSACFFALQHSFIPFLPDASFILYRFLMFLPLAFIMCFWYRKSRNPLPFMVGHFMLNLATVAQIFMTSVSPEFFEMLSQ